MFGSSPFGSSTFGGIDVYSVLINVSEPIVNVFEGDSIVDQTVVTELSQVSPLPIDPNVVDSSTTAEFTALNLKEFLDVFDSTTIEDIAGFYPDLVFVTESSTIQISSLSQVFDSTSITEDIQIELNLFNLDIFDSSSIVEVLSVDVPEANEVFDATSVTEIVNVDIPLEKAVFEAVSVSESSSLDVLSEISVGEDVSITEDVQLIHTFFDQVFDLSSVTEFVSVLLPIDQGLLIHVDTYDD